MSDPHLFAEVVREAYGTEPVELEPVGNDPTGERLTYRAALGDGRVWMLRGYRAGSRMPFWHGGGPAEEWLRERVHVLEWLARQGYPAPRIVPTRNGDPLAACAGYRLLAMTYIPGQPLFTNAKRLEQLASALGRLHALGSPVSGDDGLPASWWHPLDRRIDVMLERLERAGAGVPSRWQPLHAAFVEALSALRGCGDLPLAAIHGDCYPGNAIESAEGQVTLIDWECAGRGAAVLDLGGLLLDAHPDPAPGEAVAVNPELVAAITAGYRRYREPTGVERERLLDAMQFGVAFVGTLRFVWASEDGWSERIERSLRRLEARYNAAEEVARVAGEAFGSR